MKLEISWFPQKHDTNLLIKTHSHPPSNPSICCSWIWLLISPLIALMKMNKTSDQSIPRSSHGHRFQITEEEQVCRKEGGMRSGVGGWNRMWNSQIELNTADPGFLFLSGLLLNIYYTAQTAWRYYQLFCTLLVYKHICSHTGTHTVCR